MCHQWIGKSVCRVRLDQLAASGLVLLVSACLLVGCNGRSSQVKTGNGLSKSQEPFVPPEELWELNNQGVGYMEQFDRFGGFPKAVPIFEEIVQRWPNWTPGKFNLAVALLNAYPTQQIERAKRLLAEVLATNEKDARAHYTLGFLLQYQGQFDEARPHFEKVCFELDPTDAHSWVRLGDCINDSATESVDQKLTPQECYERAFALNPNMASACYKLSQHYARNGELDRAKDFRERFTSLSGSLHDVYEKDYIWSGRLAEAIGVKLPPPRPGDKPLALYETMEAKFELADDARWATAEDLAAAGLNGLLARIRERFGAGITAFDYDKDGDLDLFLPACVVRNGKLGDSLWRNDGNGHFVDVTSQVGLSGPSESIGCAVGDFDADHFPDLFVTGLTHNRLLRNAGGKSFEDVTDRASDLQTDSISLSALFVDLDHDSDLDLLIASYGRRSEADEMFQEQPYRGGARNEVFMNIGKAQKVEWDVKEMPPLEVGFQRLTPNPDALDHVARTVGFAVADIDGDRDIDLIEINDDSPCRVLLNKRLGLWEASEIPENVVPSARYNGALAADFNSDLRMDLLLTRPDGMATLLLNPGEMRSDQPPSWTATATDLHGLRSAQVVDCDFDGWLDVVGLSSTATRITLGLNRPRGMMARPEWLSGLVEEESRVQGVLLADFVGAGWPQIVILRAGLPPELLRTKGNGNNWLVLNPVGLRERTTSYDTKYPRSNPDGIGTRVIIHSGSNSTVWDNAALSSGMCQSLLPVSVGLGERSKADAVRLRWPSGVEQAELNLPGGLTHRIEEIRRRETSCPVLFAWNGTRFEFVTDFLGGGGIGYLIQPGVYSVPDPDEDVFIDPRQLVADDRGNFVLKIAEPMDEMTYLDAAWLEVIDHPADTTVFPDERFDPDEAHKSGERFCFRTPIFPIAAYDHNGRDVRGKILAWDRQTVDKFRNSAMWIGYAEPHYVELDFGQSFASLSDQEPIALFLAGWVEYPYSQTNWAASTAGERLYPPVLKWLNERGEWETLVASMGYPAGLPRMMTVDLTDKIPAAVRRSGDQNPSGLRLRIETNMEIYWDQIFAARLEPASTLRRTLLKPSHAELGYRGCLQEYTPDGRLPKLFDYHQINSVPLVGLEGARTPAGPARDLLLDDDDRFVLINAGDEVTLTYDSRELPALPSGWIRSYVLRSFGYCKDTDLFNPFGRTVEPLPSRNPGSGYMATPTER